MASLSHSTTRPPQFNPIPAAAAELRRRGFALCRIDPATKKPVRARPNTVWNQSSAEPSDFTDHMIGIQGGALSNGGKFGHALVIVDLDSPEAVARADEYLPATGMIDGRPGKPRSHRYYLVPVGSIPSWAVSSCAAGIAADRELGHPGPGTWHLPGVDLIGTGCQVVCPPSTWTSKDGTQTESRQWDEGEPGKPAAIDFETLHEAVGRLVEATGEEIPRSRRDRPRGKAAPLSADAPKAIRRAASYIAAYPECIWPEKKGNHNRLLYLATALVHGFGLDDDTVMNLLSEQYNPRCDPLWSEREFWHKVETARCNSESGIIEKPYKWLLMNINTEDETET